MSTTPQASGVPLANDYRQSLTHLEVARIAYFVHLKIETSGPSGVDLQVCTAGHKVNRIDEPMPWH